MGCGASILNPENMSKKSLCQTVNFEKESQCQVKVCKKLTLRPAKGSKKKSAAKGLTGKMLLDCSNVQKLLLI